VHTDCYLDRKADLTKRQTQWIAADDDDADDDQPLSGRGRGKREKKRKSAGDEDMEKSPQDNRPTAKKTQKLKKVCRL